MSRAIPPAPLAALALLLAASGCALSTFPSGVPATVGQQTRPESVVLDVVSLRVPLGDVELNETIWTDVDEQQLPVELRRRLTANGLRAGVLGTQLPSILLHKLEQAKPTAETNMATGETVVTDFESESPVMRRSVQVRGGRRSQIITCGERERLPELSVFLRDDEGAVTGRTYQKVMGSLEARAFPLGDNRIRLEATPVVEHGDPQRRYESREGILRIEFGAAREAFESLKLDTTLAPGQSLLIGALADRPGTLGYQCLTEHKTEGTTQKFLLVRLAQTQYDDLFTNDAPPNSND
ncbi:MAG: hypothetical protein JSS27_09505 [Planctomycetes bacterium]|nr:hypothetical protein [Planctomycetota bacterium]